MNKIRNILKFIVKNLKTHWIFLVLISFYILFSLLTYQDYGPTGDEWAEQRAAHDLFLYIQTPTDYDSVMDKRYYDSINSSIGHHPIITKYQRSYQLIQYVLNINQYYEWFHLMNLILGSMFFVCAYVLFYIHTKSQYQALVPVILLALTPRLVGHIPGNNKDMPFALMYLASLISIYIFDKYKSNTYIKIITLGLLFGIMQTYRTIGFSIYFVYVLYYLYSIWAKGKGFEIKKLYNSFLELIIIGVFSLFVSVSIFPWLGSNFFANIYELMLNSKSFQNWDDTIFFKGEFLYKGDRPWHYLFTWIFITTPLLILSLLVLSIVYLKKLLKDNLFILLVLTLIINFLLYLILQPTIYNGLRHFLYLVPLITLIASLTFIKAFQSFKSNSYKYMFFGLAVLLSLPIIYNLVTLHPYQYIYFNEVIGGLKGAYHKYELDYWGASYKEATSWILENRDVSHADIIYACNVDYSVDYYSHKEFFMSFGDPEPANYTICDTEHENNGEYEGEIIHEVKRQGVPLNIIRYRGPIEDSLNP